MRAHSIFKGPGEYIKHWRCLSAQLNAQAVSATYMWGESDQDAGISHALSGKRCKPSGPWPWGILNLSVREHRLVRRHLGARRHLRKPSGQRHQSRIVSYKRRHRNGLISVQFHSRIAGGHEAGSTGMVWQCMRGHEHRSRLLRKIRSELPLSAPAHAGMGVLANLLNAATMMAWGCRDTLNRPRRPSLPGQRWRPPRWTPTPLLVGASTNRDCRSRACLRRLRGWRSSWRRGGAGSRTSCTGRSTCTDPL
jgi:hypothetical protein